MGGPLTPPARWAAGPAPALAATLPRRPRHTPSDSPASARRTHARHHRLSLLPNEPPSPDVTRPIAAATARMRVQTYLLVPRHPQKGGVTEVTDMC